MDNSNPLTQKILEVRDELDDDHKSEGDLQIVVGRQTSTAPKEGSTSRKRRSQATVPANAKPPKARRPNADRSSVEGRSLTEEMAQHFTRPTVPLTTRLQPNTAEALERARLERRLRRQEPSSKQDIAQQALDEWLRRHGYLPEVSATENEA